MMRRGDTYNGSQSRQRHIIREENPLYDDRSRRRSAPRQEEFIEMEADYDDGETVVDYNERRTDNRQMEYDYAMEELLQQLPSRQQGDVATTASQALWRKQLGSTIRSRAGGTMRINRNDDVENHIVATMQQDLWNDDQLYEGLDDAVRTIPTTLSRKITIKHRLTGKKAKHLSRWKIIKYNCSTLWQHAKYAVGSQTARIFHLWESHLKTIEGCFGTSVVSYFIFLKSVLLINIPIFMLTFSFIVIPHILNKYYQMKSGSGDNPEDFGGIELLTGTGFFTHSEMYYGFYTSDTVTVVGGTNYEMKYAYLLTCGGYYLFCLIILGYSYLRSYRKYYIEVSGSLRLYYFSLVFCGWDYGITSQETGLLKHRSIYNEFKEYLDGMNTTKIKPKRIEFLKKWGIRLLAWTVVLALITASGYATYITSKELSIKPNLPNSTEIIASSLAMPFVVSSIHLIIPIAFSLMEGYEQFSRPKYELYIHMFREQLLRATNLAVLVYFWLHLAPSQLECWETFVGQEIYRLTIMDLIFGLLYSFIMEFIRKLCTLKWPNIRRAEFAIASHTLELIYTQSLCWLGVFYCPLLPVVVILKLIVTFYVKRYSVIQNCRPSLKPWRASRTHTHFVGYIFIFFVLTCAAVCFSIIEVKPSSGCGPYQNYTTSYQVVTILVGKWEKNYKVFGRIVNIINSPGFAFGALIILGVLLYYIRTVSLSRKKRVETFKMQLVSEAKDKKYLLNQINQARFKGYTRPVHTRLASQQH